ncbi:hypothetical protein GGX14DRAFT_387225 [Mycena pura]|uniref:Uncharacterized protein n=1 Tax=Mycena pura TaxID=153505 RepID=A0AAD6YNW1_9AGAR|nr:hypothetical protein GGX14DRAFT_387225 [Mycena pura]
MSQCKLLNQIGFNFVLPGRSSFLFLAIKASARFQRAAPETVSRSRFQSVAGLCSTSNTMRGSSTGGGPVCSVALPSSPNISCISTGVCRLRQLSSTALNTAAGVLRKSATCVRPPTGNILQGERGHVEGGLAEARNVELQVREAPPEGKRKIESGAGRGEDVELEAHGAEDPVELYAGPVCRVAGRQETRRHGSHMSVLFQTRTRLEYGKRKITNGGREKTVGLKAYGTQQVSLFSRVRSLRFNVDGDNWYMLDPATRSMI